MMKKTTIDPDARRGQAGFTLVETLVAIVVLTFGLMAVTNLLLVSASSDQVANQATAAATSASQVMDVLKSQPWSDLDPAGHGGNLTADTQTPAPNCRALPVPITGVFNCDDVIDGVGTIKTRWTIAAVAGTGRLLMVTVRSEGTGVLGAGRTTTTFTALRACTESTLGSCPALPGGICCPTS